MERIIHIEDLIKNSKTMQDLLLNPLSKMYDIKKKSSNLKEIYTADINKKIRLYMKPVGDYPYNLIEIDIVEFQKIDDKHYGEG